MTFFGGEVAENPERKQEDRAKAKRILLLGDKFIFW
jgi:hypothetical protein